MMGFGLLGMLLFWIVLLVFLVGGAILVFRQATGTRLPGDQHQPTAVSSQYSGVAPVLTDF